MTSDDVEVRRCREPTQSHLATKEKVCGPANGGGGNVVSLVFFACADEVKQTRERESVNEMIFHVTSADFVAW